ncbi:ABC-2 type transport system permease protein [Streptomyces sp. PvR006]|uniref:ABC transporter permease n=1 Tax=unclassified Streptomyces TaxID=2593676 RepID=UPI001AE821A5|nr:ABC transporter permease [Streptomyces sp. PvR006]MBP2583593.1 ABC-2 type transport system permease protein [Streptomyces sp. PvR006]
MSSPARLTSRTPLTPGPPPAARTRIPSRGRLVALGRAELTLLVRNRSALFGALLVPLLTVGAVRSSLQDVDLGTAGTTIAEVAVTGAIGMALLIGVHSNLVAAFAARREALVLKRLRTGEPTDPEILTGIALPAATLALAQSAVLAVGGIAALDLPAPARPDLLLAGVVLGTVLLSAVAAATSAVTRTAESAQLTALPLVLVSSLGSGLFVPLSMLPDRLASVCELLPMTGVMTLVRAGWSGGAEGGDLLGAAAVTVAWIAVSVFAVQRWFRWEPRR